MSDVANFTGNGGAEASLLAAAGSLAADPMEVDFTSVRTSPKLFRDVLCCQFAAGQVDEPPADFEFIRFGADRVMTREYGQSEFLFFVRYAGRWHLVFGVPVSDPGVDELRRAGRVEKTPLSRGREADIKRREADLAARREEGEKRAAERRAADERRRAAEEAHEKALDDERGRQRAFDERVASKRVQR